MTSNVVAKNSLMRGKFTRMVLWMPSFISFFEMPSIMNLASQMNTVLLRSRCIIFRNKHHIANFQSAVAAEGRKIPPPLVLLQ